MSGNKGGKFGLLNKIAPKRKVNTHISQYYKKGGCDRRDSDSSRRGHKDKSVGKWAAFKNIFSPLSFQTHRDKSKSRRPKQSRDMVMYHHIAAGMENGEEAAGNTLEGVAEKDDKEKKNGKEEKKKNEKDVGNWSTFTHSNTETNV